LSGASCRHGIKPWIDHNEQHAQLLADVMAEVMLCEQCSEPEKALWLIWLRDTSTELLAKLLPEEQPQERPQELPLELHAAPSELVCMN
jgi:hypothetical protein